MGKNILITGGAGFIGYALAERLAQSNHNITILDNFSIQIHGELTHKQDWIKNLNSKFKLIVGDIRDKKVVKQAVQNQEIIFHFAAETGTGQSMYEIEKYCSVNISGTAVLLECIMDSPIQHLILASSRSIYGEGRYCSKKYGIVFPKIRKLEDLENGKFEPSFKDDENLIVEPTNEESKLNPVSVYASTKLTQEHLVQNICESLKIKSTIFRFQNVYGPGQALNNPYTGILSIFSKRILHGKELLVFEDGKESRDFIYIDDLTAILESSLIAEKLSNNIINVGSGIGTSIYDVAQILKEAFKSNVEIKITGNFRLGDIRHNFADISRLKNLIGITPKVNFREGATLFTKWVKNQELEEDKLDQSLDELRKKGLLK